MGIDDSNYIGVIPAAGAGSRLFPFNNSKELLPVGIDTTTGSPILVIQYAIKSMVAAGITSILITINPDKQNIVKLLKDGSDYGINIAYIVGEPNSMVHSIDLAYEWIKGKNVIMAMGDTVIKPESSIKQLITYSGDEMLSLGLFTTDNPSKFGMIEIDENSKVIDHIDKPDSFKTNLMWGVVAWKKEVTELIHEKAANHTQSTEMRFGDIIDELHQKDSVYGYKIKEGSYYDVGTYEEYARAIKEIQ